MKDIDIGREYQREAYNARTRREVPTSLNPAKSGMY